MAFTVSSTADDTVMGNARVRYLRVTADGTEDNVSSGLQVVYGLSVAAASMASAPALLKENRDSSGTAANGTIGVSGVASGDELLLVVYGR